MIELRRITPETFAPYGRLVTWSAADGRRLQTAIEESTGMPWMLATFRVDAHEVTYLAEHPDSIELFAPLAGVGVLLLALSDAPERYDAFLLDVPVVINRGVWHGMCALSAEAVLVIAENAEAGGTRRYLDRPLVVGLAPGA